MKENSEKLKKFPYHPYPYETTDPTKIIKSFDNNHFDPYALESYEAYYKNQKKTSDNILASGLIIDEDYNVFVNPEYGAFFYNTKCKTIQEEIVSCKDMQPIMINCYVAQEELLSYINMGYEFVIGPCVKVIDDDEVESLNGVYCKNYNKIYKKKKGRFDYSRMPYEKKRSLGEYVVESGGFYSRKSRYDQLLNHNDHDPLLDRPYYTYDLFGLSFDDIVIVEDNDEKGESLKLKRKDCDGSEK